MGKTLQLSSQNTVNCYNLFYSVSKFLITNTTFFFSWNIGFITPSVFITYLALIRNFNYQQAHLLHKSATAHGHAILSNPKSHTPLRNRQKLYAKGLFQRITWIHPNQKCWTWLSYIYIYHFVTYTLFDNVVGCIFLENLICLL